MDWNEFDGNSIEQIGLERIDFEGGLRVVKPAGHRSKGATLLTSGPFVDDVLDGNIHALPGAMG